MRDVRGRAVRACVFDTAIGPCGVAWTRRGIVRLQLPEGGRAATLARTVAGLDGACAVARPPAPVARAIRRIRGHLSGSPDNMRSVALDLSGATPFERKVYEAARGIGPGATARYGEIACRIGAPRSARAV
ncbi:MAG: MGMT family protein, partial [Myxococcota bacterium]|nr:MGMT family protein [Myxococcota bacterium]